jgi:hypothetical protein
MEEKSCEGGRFDPEKGLPADDDLLGSLDAEMKRFMDAVRHYARSVGARLAVEAEIIIEDFAIEFFDAAESFIPETARELADAAESFLKERRRFMERFSNSCEECVSMLEYAAENMARAIGARQLDASKAALANASGEDSCIVDDFDWTC